MEATFDLCVVGGCGHVGLPLAMMFADRGKRVVAYDVNQAAIDRVEKGTMPFREHGAQDVLSRVLNKSLFFSSDASSVQRAKVLIVTIGTPVDEHINPQFTPIFRFIEQVEPFLGPEHVVIMRSTVFPGTSEYIRRYFEQRGKKSSICFCPERIAEGQAVDELTQLPQIISAFDDYGLRVCRELFSVLTDHIVVLSPAEAELAKLFTNTWRYIKFGIANQFYMIASEHNVDFGRISHAMRFNYPRAADFPRPGFTAGPCLLKDTMQLAAFYKHQFFLGHAAMLVNEGMPDHIKHLLKREMTLSGKTVGILGMSFKAESDDIRESLAFKLKKLLMFEGATVLCSDEYWKNDSLVDREVLLRKSDVIVIGCPHKAYKDIDFRGKRVVDIWESTKGV